SHAKALGEAVEELAGQRDLGNEDQRLFSPPNDLADSLEINLRLARSGDAVEQRDAIAAGDDRRAQRIRRFALHRREPWTTTVRIRGTRHRLWRQHQAL